MFLGPPGPDCKPHMYRIRHVLPQPVSPMMTTGMPHLGFINFKIERAILETENLSCFLCKIPQFPSAQLPLIV